MRKLNEGETPSPIVDSRKFNVEYIEKPFDGGGTTCALKWHSGDEYFGEWILVSDNQVAEAKQYIYNIYFDWVKERHSL